MAQNPDFLDAEATRKNLIDLQNAKEAYTKLIEKKAELEREIRDMKNGIEKSEEFLTQNGTRNCVLPVHGSDGVLIAYFIDDNGYIRDNMNMIHPEPKADGI